MLLFSMIDDTSYWFHFSYEYGYACIRAYQTSACFYELRLTNRLEIDHRRLAIDRNVAYY